MAAAKYDVNDPAHQNLQNLQILQFQNSKLSEQLATQKEQIKALEANVQKFDEQKKEYTDTMLCVNRIWQQFNTDIKRLCTQEGADNPDAAAGPGDPADAAQAAASAPDGEDAHKDDEPEPLVWNSYDPFLAHLLQGDTASAMRAIKKHTQAYLADLTTVEEALHARAAAGQAALANLLDAIKARSAAAAQEQEQLRQMPADDALKAANEQLQEEVTGLQEQLEAATALQRSTQALLKQAEDRRFEAEHTLKSCQNDLADKEDALQAAQRKLERLRQQHQQQQVAPAGAGGPPGAGIAAAAAAGGGGADEAAAATQELQAQVTQLQELLEARTTERDQQMEEVARMQRELAELQSRSGDETWVADSLLYKLAQQQLSDAQAQLDARSKQLAALQHDKDELLRHFENKATATETERVLRSQALHLQQQVNELNAKQVELLGQKQALQVSHQQELSRYGHLKTASELQCMLAALQKEVDTNTGHARKAAEASAAADAARQEAQGLRAQLTAAQATVKGLQSRLHLKASELQGLSGREEELKERLNDLHAFVEVLTTVASDARELLEVRRSEATLKAQLADAHAKIKGDGLQQQLAAASATEADLRKQLETSVAEAASLQGDVQGLRGQVAALQEEVKSKQRESEAFANEIGDALSAFEQQRQQNSTLLQQLVERDTSLNATKADLLKLRQQLETATEQLGEMRMRVTSLEGELNQAKAVREAMEKDFNRVSGELATAREQLVSANSSLDQVKAELKAAQDSRASLQVLYDKEQEGHQSSKQAAEEAAAELRQEASKRQRLQDSNAMMRQRIQRLTTKSERSAEVMDLEEQNDAMRRMITCSLCDQRQKNRMIVKCGHMFCAECLGTAQTSRNRKCPGCGEKYTSSEVKQSFFTY